MSHTKACIYSSIRLFLSVHYSYTTPNMTSPINDQLSCTVCRCPKARRSELLTNNEIPTQSEVKHYLGPDLFQVLCEFSHPDVKKFLGITPPLRGTDEELWLSPYDQLLGKVCLKPPLTHKCIKACTHEGILRLGEQAKQRWEIQTAARLRNELEKNMGDNRLMFEAEKRHAVNLAISHTKKLYEVHLDALTKEHEKELECAVARVLRNVNEKIRALRLRERENVTRELMSKLKDEINYIVTHLCEEFDRESQAQKNIMVSEFNRIIRQERAMANSKLRASDQQKAEDLQQLRAQLEKEFETRRTDIVQGERINMRARQRSLYQIFRKKINGLENLLSKAKYVIELLGDMLEKPHPSGQNSWRQKVCEIIIQFEKFINIAFEEVPGQTELISILKAILCKKTSKKPGSVENNEKVPDTRRRKSKGVARSLMRKEKFQVLEIIDKHGDKWRPIQLLPDVPQLYCTEEQLLTPIGTPGVDICHDDDYVNKDSLVSCSTLASDESLPYVYYNNKLYVRSDYNPDNEGPPPEMKKMTELAEDGRFILGLDDPQPCNILIDDIRDDPSSVIENQILTRSMDDEDSMDDEFEMHVQNLIDTIERINDESSIMGDKLNGHDQDKVVRDLINHLKAVKNSKETREQYSRASAVNEHFTNEETDEQSAISRVQSLIKVFRLHPHLQNTIMRAANDRQVNK